MFTAGEVALNVSDAYYEPYEEIYNDGKGISNINWTGGVSVCVLNTSQLEPLAAITKQALSENAGDKSLPSTLFDYDQRSASEGHVGYYDMKQMMRSLLDDSSFAAWEQVYDLAVPASWWKTTPQNYSAFSGMFSMEGSSGVSHYIPTSNKSADAAYRATEWYQAAGIYLLGW